MDSIELHADVASVGTARRFVEARVIEHHLDPSDAVMLTSELVTNVVRHARTDFTVTIRFDPCLRIEVHDGAAATETFHELVANPPTVPAHSLGGRGLFLIRALATRFGLADEPGIWNGKIVWFEIDALPLPSTPVDRR